MTPQRIALATFGSYGDLHPYLAIAKELQRRGHYPIIATLPVYQEKVETAGFPFRALRTSLIGEPDRELMRKVMDMRRGTRFIVRDLVMPALSVAYADACEAFRDVSLVVVHPLAFSARLAAETMRLPWVSTQLAPIAYVSAYDPPVVPGAAVLTRLRPLGPVFFRPFFGLARAAARSWTRPYERFRAELGLPAAGNPMFEGSHAPGLELALFSRLLGQPMPDWPAQAAVTGFPFYDGEENTLTPELERFLDDGPAPVVFTLGTSAVRDAGDFYQQSAAAAERLGVRAILLVGTEPQNKPARLPANILAVAYTPFSLLFQRCAAIVHQGGVGTTAQAMRAGRPMLVVPFLVDQPDNADRVRRLGIARVLERKLYRAETAARELTQLLNDGKYQASTTRVAQQIAQEDGPATACDLLLSQLG